MNLEWEVCAAEFLERAVDEVVIFVLCQDYSVLNLELRKSTVAECLPLHTWRVYGFKT
jgi:hypothetical protein